MLGNKIKKLREEKNITQANLAKLLDVSPSTVGMWEQNRRTPDIEILKNLSDILNVSVDYLIGKSIIKESADILFNKTPTTFSEILKSKRKELNLSLRSAAELIGISHSYLSILEKGIDPRSNSVSKPTPETLKLISKAYHLDYNELMQIAGYISDTNDALFEEGKFDIEKEAKKIIENINKLDVVKFCGTLADEEDKEYLKLVSERFLSDIRVYNKQKYTTPKKNSIKEELEAYKAELEAEEKEKTLSASERQDEDLNQKNA